MGGRFFILALCIFGAYSLPAPKTVSDGVSVVDVINQIEGIINIHSNPLKAQRSLSVSQIENILYILNEIEGIINIHSEKSIQDTGVINWPVVIDVAEKIESILAGLKVRSSLTPTQIVNILNEIEGIINIHSLQTRSSVSAAQIDNVIKVLGQIEGIINIHSAKSISDTGVINWPVVVDVIQKIEGVLVSFKARGTLTASQVDTIFNILNEIEGIVNIHSQEVVPAPRLSEGVVNVPVVIDVINKIEGIVSTLNTRATISASEAENIITILNKIEGIINIHSIELNARSSLTSSQIDNIWKLLNEIEGIINIHSEPINPRSTASIIDILNAIENIVQIH